MGRLHHQNKKPLQSILRPSGKIIEDKEYKPEQGFNMEEIGLFLKEITFNI